MNNTMIAPQLCLDMEELESLEAPSWDQFFGGVGIGIGLVGLVYVGIAIT